jgi:hypothetical protein
MHCEQTSTAAGLVGLAASLTYVLDTGAVLRLIDSETKRRSINSSSKSWALPIPQ